MLEKEYIIYVLRSKRNGKRYVGLTSDIHRRLSEHNRGISRFTSQNRPWELIYQEAYQNKQGASKREKFLKSGQGRKFLDTITSSNSTKSPSHSSGIV